MRIRIVDAFTDRPFAGNQAGVCLLEAGEWPPERWMQQVAAELNLAETAFARPEPDGADWGIRWFTPAVEVDLCGHATLATAHVMHTEGVARGAVRFTCRSGSLMTDSRDDGTIVLDFPAARLSEAPVPDGLAEALGVRPEAALRTGDLGDLLAVLPDEAAVRAVVPDSAALDALLRREGHRGLIVTAPGTEHDFVSRFFAPPVGIPEDPVTGSAHTALAPYWAERLGRAELVGFQASTRTGVVRVAVRGDRVHLTGTAVTVLDGTLLV